MRKAKGKAKANGKGNGKEKGKGRGKVRAFYFGDPTSGYTICTLAYGDNLGRAPPNTAIGALVDVREVAPRLGQVGVVYWTGKTQIVVHMEERDRKAPLEFPYDTTVGSSDFASNQSLQEFKIGAYVAFPFRALSVQEKYTRAGRGDPYLEVQGVDCEGAAFGTLRFWRFSEGAVSEGGIYLARELKVAVARVWDYRLEKYVPNPDLLRTLECNARTAIEDVSNTPTISTFF